MSSLNSWSLASCVKGGGLYPPPLHQHLNFQPQVDIDIDIVQHFSNRGFHIGARALLDIQYNLIWFGYIALRWGGSYDSSKWEERRIFLVISNYFYLPLRRLHRKGRWGQHPMFSKDCTFLFGLIYFILSGYWIYKYRTLIKRKGNKLKEAHIFAVVIFVSPPPPSSRHIGRLYLLYTAKKDWEWRWKVLWQLGGGGGGGDGY